MRENITATFKSKSISNAKNFGHNKETVNTYDLVVIDEKQLRNIITVRFYMGRSRSASSVICSLWVNGNGYHVSGSGSAGGYGYDKQSASFYDASKKAGIKYKGFVGQVEVDSAMIAIGKAMGYTMTDGKYIIVRN